MPTRTRKHYVKKPPKKPEPQRRVLVFEGDRPAMRGCLRCGREFVSRGPGNRICKGCGKEREGYGVRAVLHLD